MTPPSDMVGKQAPTFALPDQDGKIHKLSEYKRKYIGLYRHPMKRLHLMPLRIEKTSGADPARAQYVESA